MYHIVMKSLKMRIECATHCVGVLGVPFLILGWVGCAVSIPLEYLALPVKLCYNMLNAREIGSLHYAPSMGFSEY